MALDPGVIPEWILETIRGASIEEGIYIPCYRHYLFSPFLLLSFLFAGVGRVLGIHPLELNVIPGSVLKVKPFLTLERPYGVIGITMGS